MDDYHNASIGVEDLVRRLEADCDQLRARLAVYESSAVLPDRPILDLSEAMLAGYLLLESDERQFTALALSEHSDFVAVWYRYLNLFRDVVLGEGSLRENTNWSVQHQLAMRFAAVAIGTAKLVLDAGLAGYYMQASALCATYLKRGSESSTSTCSHRKQTGGLQAPMTLSSTLPTKQRSTDMSKATCKEMPSGQLRW